MSEQTIKIVMPKSHKHKPKKHFVKVKKLEPRENLKETVKSEIKTLEEQREKQPKGIRGFLGKLSINKKISDRRKYLNMDRNIQVTKKQVEFAKAKAELENERAKLKEMNEKRQVNFDGLGGLSSSKKPLRIEDLY